MFNVAPLNLQYCSTEDGLVMLLVEMRNVRVLVRSESSILYTGNEREGDTGSPRFTQKRLESICFG